MEVPSDDKDQDEQLDQSKESEKVDAEEVDPEQAAAAAVAALIRSGKDARSLFDALRCFDDNKCHPGEYVVELGTMLDAWEAHLPPGHRSVDAPFRSDLASVCHDVDWDFSNIDCLAQLLVQAIEKAALRRLRKARAASRWL